jgi:putative glutamine amidotransferase
MGRDDPAPVSPLIATAWAKPDYVAALTGAGATLRELDAAHDDPASALRACAGLLLTGGVDVDPARYGDDVRHPTVEVDLVRDRFELALAREALARELPILAICRGAQVLNVAAGGTLIQDVPSARPDALRHRIDNPKDALAHEVRVESGTSLASLLARRLSPDGRVAVNSRHHQSVRDLAPGFIASATAPDGIIEAIERRDAGFCVGVQWHPENFWRTGEFADLFRGFVDAATSYRPR